MPLLLGMLPLSLLLGVPGRRVGPVSVGGQRVSLQHVVLCPLGLYLEWRSGGVGSVRGAGCGPADGSPPGEGGSGAVQRRPSLPESRVLKDRRARCFGAVPWDAIKSKRLPFSPFPLSLLSLP